jgi:CBS-domain-containing membrane protein
MDGSNAKNESSVMTTFTTQDRQDAQRTPLTQEQIDNILESLDVYIDTHAGVMQFARAIERAHGIGE